MLDYETNSPMSSEFSLGAYLRGSAAPVVPAPPASSVERPSPAPPAGSAGRFHVAVRNASGVKLELDGHALPPLGAPGQVVRDATVPREAQP